MERIECIELDKRKKMRIFSMIGGAMFSCAWWVFISAIASVQHRQDPLQPTAVLYLPGIGSTMMFVIIQLMDWEALYADDLTHHDSFQARMGARALLTFAICLGLGSLFGSIVIFADVYAQGKGINGIKPESTFPGAAIFLQSMLLFMGSFITRLGRIQTSDDMM